MRTVPTAEGSVLLACTTGLPVDCFPLDGYHHCVDNACGCDVKPRHC